MQCQRRELDSKTHNPRKKKQWDAEVDVSTLGCRVARTQEELVGTYASLYGYRPRLLTDYRSRVCFSLYVYPNIIIGSQLRLMYGPETNHQSIQIIRAYSNGEREPKGPETRKRNAQAGRLEWIETCTDRSSTWSPLPQW